MKIISKNIDKDIDLEEIFLHIKKLKQEKDLIKKIDKDKSIDKKIFDNNKEKIVKETMLDNISTDDIFLVVDEQEIVSKMKIKNSSLCDICGQDIVFDENLSGLVLLNKFFACEECCKNASNFVLNSWIETRNGKLEDVKPIAFWLMQEGHKTRLI